MNNIAPSRNVPLAWLRTCITLLVVAHHALLAYCQFAPPQAAGLDASLMWAAFPVVDSQRWVGADLVVSFNDNFFMSLMFLVSGVFVWSSLMRKGAGRFFRERALRLGLPFIVAAAALAPLAYYPAYLAGSGAEATGSFWQQWFALGSWPAGPAWFLWVLLAFGGIAAAGYAFRGGSGAGLGRVVERLSVRPVAFFAVLVTVSTLVYVPMADVFGSLRWTHAGPFFVQVSRVFHYLLYFVVGIGLGACGAQRGLLQPNGQLARRWPLWAVTAVAAFALYLATTMTIVSTLAQGGPGLLLDSVGNFTMVLSCASSSFALLALFVRFVRRSNRVMDSLGANAYGIYIGHYFCVTWLQFALLDVPLPGVAKAALVFACALAASWALSAALRRIPAVARVV